MTITYTKDSNQIYPYQIAYTGNSGLSTDKTVEFELDDRDDDIQSYKTKALVTTSKRLSTITVKKGSTTVYKYILSYDNSGPNGRSRLSQIRRVTPNAVEPYDETNSLPPTDFSWIDGGDGTFGSPDTMNLAGGTTGGKIAFGDINGDGREDFIKYCFSPLPIVVAYPYLANDSGGFNPQSPMYLGMWLDADSVSTALGDINGDGKADIVFNDMEEDGYFNAFLSNGDGTFDSGHRTPSQAGITSIYLSELNGDGLADLVSFNSSEGKVWSHLSNGDGTFESQGRLKDFNTIGGTIHLGDVNGDGITDLCIFDTLTQINISIIGFSLGNGSGEFDTSYWWSYPLGSPGISRKGALADVNGDGLADFIMNTSDKTIAVFISTGTGMTGPYTTTFPGTLVGGLSGAADINDDGMADVITYDTIFNIQLFYKSNGDGTFAYPFFISEWPDARLADIDGDGRPDLINHDSTANSISYRYANGGDAADRIESIMNPLGGETTITYGNNTDIENNWVPFTLHPVMEIETDDGYNVSMTTYAYSDAVYNYEERDFRGFEFVTQTNPDMTTVKTTYEVDDDYLKGRPLTIEMTAPGESYPFCRTTYTWGTYTISGTDAEFVKLTRKKVEINDNHDVNIDDEHTQADYTYDNTHGGVLTTVSSGSGGVENVTVTNTYINKGTWVWRKASESITGSSTGLARQTNHTYYSATGNLATKTNVNTSGSNPVEEYTYDSYGNLYTYEDPENKTTTYTYDSATHTYATGVSYPTTGSVTHSVGMTYSDFGKVESETDENNNTTDYHYDEYGRLYWVEYPDGGEVEYDYVDYTSSSAPAYVKTSVLEETSSYVDTYQYVDGFGRNIMNVSRSSGSNYSVTRQYYDAMGRNDYAEGPYFVTTYAFNHTPPSLYPTIEKTFDFAGRVESIKMPHYQGSALDSFDTTTISYDGFVTTIADADGNIRTEITDYLGRIISVVEDSADGGTTLYEYNAAGDLTDVYDDDNNHTDIGYNTLGQKISMTDPDMGSWSYTYDLNGNLHTQTDAKSQVVTFAYDELNRIEQKSYSTSDPTVYYYYDDLTIDNGRGRLDYVTNGSVTTTYNGYDEMGRVESVTKTITGDQARTTSFTYDLSGKSVRTTYPDSFWTENSYYPGTNLLYSVTGSDGEEYAEITTYSPSGKIGRINHDNNSYTIHTYDARSEKLYQIRTYNSSSALIQKKRYFYTSIGEISTINDLHNGNTYTYTYDSLSRLKTEVINGSTTSMSVSYDSLGNITSKTMNGNSFIYAYDGNQAHAVSSITYGTQRNFTYDNNGNMTYGWDFTNPASPKSRQIDYNADNMPETITYNGSTTTTLLYDGMGTRVKKSVGSTHTYYIGDHFEIRGGGTNVKYIFADNLRVAQVEGNTRSYFHKDHLGSSTVMTNNSGAELESTEYMPFGSQRNHSGTDTSDYRFTDQELDSENGLYNYGARLYDPFIGRFISPDSIVPEPFNPQSLNRYSYCLNNPLIYTDPSGHAQLTYEQWVAEMESQRADMNIPDYSKFITGFELDDYYMANAPWWWSFDDYGRDAEIEFYLGGGGGGGTWSPGGVSTILCNDPVGRVMIGHMSGYDIYSVNKYKLRRDYDNGVSKEYLAPGFISHRDMELGIYHDRSNGEAAQIGFHEGVHAWQYMTNNAGSWTRGERDFEAYYMEVEFALRNDLTPRNPDFVMIDDYGNSVPNPYAIQRKVDQYEGSGIGYEDTTLIKDFKFGPIRFTCP